MTLARCSPIFEERRISIRTALAEAIVHGVKCSCGKRQHFLHPFDNVRRQLLKRTFKPRAGFVTVQASRSDGVDNHVAGLDLAASGAAVESGWNKPFDLTEADMKFCGIDLHSNNSVAVVSDAEDWILSQLRLPNELGAILPALAPHRDELAGVVVESSYYGRPGIMHGLSAIPRCFAQFLRTPGCASPTIDFA
jgi:hypothetical protein